MLGKYFELKSVTFIKIFRPLNLIFIGLCVLFGGLLAANFDLILFKDSQLVLATFSLIFVAAAGYVWNDICDLEIDEVNRPQRVLPQKILSKNTSLWIVIIFAFLGFLFSLLLGNFLATLLVNLNLLILFAYSKWLKNIFLLGNLTIGILTASSFILGEVVYSTQVIFTIIPAIFAFLLNLAREILKDIEDLEGDLIGNRKTIPQRLSIQMTQKIIASILFLVILFSLFPYFLGIYSKLYLFSILVSVDLVLSKWIFDLLKNEKINFSKMQRMMKFDMLFVIFSIWLGKVW